MSNIDNFSWRCFLALENEFIHTMNFVEFHKNNYKTFSIIYRSIIMQTCSEIEILCKKICGIAPEDKTKNMLDYGRYFSENHSDFFKIEILIPIFNEKISPWQACKMGKIPSFWSAYNNIKHQGRLEDATLENAFHSLAALFSLLLAWYFKSHGGNFSADEAITLPRLFTYPGLAAVHRVIEGSYNIIVPGFHIAEEVA